MKKMFLVLITFIIVGLLYVPAVSADNILYDEDLVQYIDTGSNGERTASGNTVDGNALSLHFNDITLYRELSYIIADVPGHEGTTLNVGRNEFEYVFNGETRPGVIYKSVETDLVGTVKRTRLTIFLNNWDIGSLSGAQKIALPFTGSKDYGRSLTSGDSPVYIVITGTSASFPGTSYYTVASTIPWKNHIEIIEESQPHGYNINLERTILGDMYTSTINCSLNDVVLFSNTERGAGFSIWYPYGDIDTVTVINPNGVEYPYHLVGEDPEGTVDRVTIYIRNSQTGALLANAHINISASVNGNLHEVVNGTAPSGIYSIDLQPTGGGMPNPDFYRLWVTLDGYNSQMPYMDFEVRGGVSIYEYMEPTTGGPADENMTFVEFYVRDIYANPLANADVNCGGYTLKTNSAGYTQFELPKNAVYSYRVSKSGYMTIEGIATVESDGRYTVNVALMAGAVPTHTAVTPTITIEPTPTQTTPPIQEDNIIGLSVKGLAKGFGIDYDTALLLFGLMIIFGAGGIVMNSVNGGAMEFIAGSIVGTFVAFALGLIPIWIFIIIAVVFGAYVLRVFLQGGQ